MFNAGSLIHVQLYPFQSCRGAVYLVKGFVLSLSGLQRECLESIMKYTTDAALCGIPPPPTAVNIYIEVFWVVTPDRVAVGY
jgi:hypothetical protein